MGWGGGGGGVFCLPCRLFFLRWFFLFTLVPPLDPPLQSTTANWYLPQAHTSCQPILYDGPSHKQLLAVPFSPLPLYLEIFSQTNRPFSSSLVPLFQSESKCKTILMKMTDLHENETACRTRFHMKGLWLVLKQRHKRTQNWPSKVLTIRFLYLTYFEIWP